MAILILIATILLPPLGVAAKHGLGKTALINLVLTLLGEGAKLTVYARYVRRGGLDISPWRATPGLTPPSPLRLARQ